MYPRIPNLKYTETGNFFLIAGPCVIEDHDNPFVVCQRLKEIAERLQLPFAFKASYRKANRSSITSFTGIGDHEGLEILAEVRRRFGVPVVTDIHSAADAEMAAPYVDVLQIPAFLCRQTDLLQAAAATGRCVNVKKGQFLSPEAMKQVSDKMRAFGCENFMLTERGTTFGYKDLMVDFRGVKVMQQYAPVIVDITHSLQQPNQTKGVTGGQPEFIELMARASIAVGADGLFLETHQDPSVAKSDGANMLRLDLLEGLLTRCATLRRTINQLSK